MTTALARRFIVDVATVAAPTTWVRFKGINDLSVPVSPNLQPADDYDSDGWNSFEKTMQGWVLTAKALRKTVAGVFDPGQEILRTAHTQFGDLGRAYVRYYDRNGAPEAYSGLGMVGFVPSKTGVADLDEITVTITGDGALTAITNPYAPAVVPVVLAASSTPAAQVAGGLVTITGTGFTGTVPTTGVKFNSVNATSWYVVSDNTIVAVMPAGSAGAGNIVVTNATGPSTPAFPYTRGA